MSGGSTFTVSLPKAWVEGMGMGAGDGVAISRGSGGSLVLNPDSDAAGAGGRAVVTAGRKDAAGSLGRRIVATYLAGYGSILVRSGGGAIPPGHAREVRDLARSSLIGTEIVEEGPGAITMQVLTRLPDLSFDAAMRKMALTAACMHREAVECLAAGDAARAAGVAGMGEEVVRFSLYMRRNLSLAVQDAGVLACMGIARPADCLGHRYAVGRIERVAGLAAAAAARAGAGGGPLGARSAGRVRGLSRGALAALEGAISALLDRDYRLAERTAGSVAEIVESVREIAAMEPPRGAAAAAARLALEDVRRTAEYAGDIAEVAIDESVGSVILSGGAGAGPRAAG